MEWLEQAYDGHYVCFIDKTHLPSKQQKTL